MFAQTPVRLTLRRHVGGVVYVKASAAEVTLVPAAVVTVTSTSPAACAGLTHVMCEASTTTTEVAPVKFAPVMVTEVPPAVVPVAGLTVATVGAAR